MMFKSIISKKLSTTALALLCCATLSSQTVYGMNNDNDSNHPTVHQLDETALNAWNEIPKNVKILIFSYLPTEYQYKYKRISKYYKEIGEKSISLSSSSIQYEDLSKKSKYYFSEYFSANNINDESLPKYFPLLNSLHIGEYKKKMGVSLQKDTDFVRYFPQNMEDNKLPIFEKFDPEQEKTITAVPFTLSQVYTHSTLQGNGFFYEVTRKALDDDFIEILSTKLKNTGINKLLLLQEHGLTITGLKLLFEKLKETKITSLCLPLFFATDQASHTNSCMFNALIKGLNNNTNIDTIDLTANFIANTLAFEDDRQVFTLGNDLKNNLPNEKKRIIILKDNDDITKDMKSKIQKRYTHIHWIFDNDSK